MVDYADLSARSRAAGFRAGQAQGQMQRDEARRQRKALMEQQFAQLAQDKKMRANELARTQYVNAVKAQAAEDTEFNRLRQLGHITPEGVYTNKFFEEKARAARAADGVTYSPEDQQLWENTQLEAAIKNAKRGHAAGFNRKYKQGALGAVLEQQLSYNERVAAIEAQRQYHGTGVEGAMSRLGQGIVDNLFGNKPPEMPQAPTGSYMASGEQFGNLPMTPRDDIALAATDASRTFSGETKRLYVDPDTGEVVQTVLGPNNEVGIMEFDEEGKPKFTPKPDYVPYVKGKGGDADTKNLTIDQRADIPVEVREKFRKAKRVIDLGLDITKIAMTPEIGATSVGWYAKTLGLIGKEIAGLRKMFGGEDSEAKAVEFIKQRFDNTFRAGWNEREGYNPETTAEINTILGELDAKRLSLAYLLVDLNKGDKGRMSVQDLQQQLSQLKSGNLASTLATIENALDNAKTTVNTAAVEMVSARWRADTSITGSNVTDSEMKSWVAKVIQSKDDGEVWVVIDKKYRDKFGGSGAVIKANGGIEMMPIDPMGGK